MREAIKISLIQYIEADFSQTHPQNPENFHPWALKHTS